MIATLRMVFGLDMLRNLLGASLGKVEVNLLYFELKNLSKLALESLIAPYVITRSPKT